VFIDFRLARCAENAKPDDSSFDSGTFLGGFFVQRQQTKNKIDTSYLVGRSGKKREKQRVKAAARSVKSEPARRTAQQAPAFAR